MQSPPEVLTDPDVACSSLVRFGLLGRRSDHGRYASRRRTDEIVSGRADAWFMDITQLLIVVAAVLGIIVVGFLAIIPAAMELRDADEHRGAKTNVVRALATASIGRAPQRLDEDYRSRVRATRIS